MVRTGWIGRCVVLLVVAAGWIVAGCGAAESSTGASSSGDAADVRRVMVNLLTAATKGDAGVNEVRAHLAANEFEGHLRQSAPRAWDKLSAEEKESATRGCFNQLLVVPKETTLRDTASIEAALAAAQITPLKQTRTADVLFEGPSADGKGVVKFKTKLAKGRDDVWRLIYLEPMFGR
jgi:hypothetical protein